MLGGSGFCFGFALTGVSVLHHFCGSEGGGSYARACVPM